MRAAPAPAALKSAPGTVVAPKAGFPTVTFKGKLPTVTIPATPQPTAFEELATGRLLGACGLCYIDFINRSADFSIYIGADDLYIDELYAQYEQVAG